MDVGASRLGAATTVDDEQNKTASSMIFNAMDLFEGKHSRHIIKANNLSQIVMSTCNRRSGVTGMNQSIASLLRSIDHKVISASTKCE